MQDHLSDRLGIVPPKFTRYATKEFKGLHGAMQDRFGLFAGKCDRKYGAGVSPRNQQDGDSAATIWKVDFDLTKVSFHPLARINCDG